MHIVASSKRPRSTDIECPSSAPTFATRPSKRPCPPRALPSPPTSGTPVRRAYPCPAFKLPSLGAIGGTESATLLASFFRGRADASPPYLTSTTGASEDEDDACGLVRAVHREVVVNWLMEVRESVGARWTTLSLAVSILDRFLSVSSVKVGVLQLLGVTCIFIACKHEESVPTSVARLVDVWAGAIDGPRMLSLERVVLNTLGFNLVARAPLAVLDYLAEAVSSRQHRAVRVTAVFAARVALLDSKIACVRPGTVALAALHLALAIVPVDARDGDNEGRNVFAQLARACGEEFVRKVAKRILRFWNHSVISHDVGNVNFLVRDQPAVAARIFAHDSSERLSVVYGVRVARSGEFVEWAARHSIRDLLAA